VANPRKSLSVGENLDLWLRSGGMCAICKKNLILEEVGTKTNIGEKAHVIGHGDKGPRREQGKMHGIDDTNVDNSNNLIFLCTEHHKLIDTQKELYPALRLFEMKKAHEDFVLSRLNINNKSIALIHKTMHGPIDQIVLSQQIDSVLLECISYQEQFTDFTPEGWSKGKEDNEKIYKTFMEYYKVHNGVRAEIFPLSPIPLLIHLGTLISDTVPVTIYQYDRFNQGWVSSAPPHLTNSLPDLGLTTLFLDNQAKVLTCIISVSYPVHLEDIEVVVDQSEFDILNISVAQPSTELVLYKEHVSQISRQFKIRVEELHEKKRYNDIHLFYAGPAGLAVELGRSVNKNIWPYIHLYHYRFREMPRHLHALSV
jgi:hypothetical protein